MPTIAQSKYCDGLRCAISNIKFDVLTCHTCVHLYFVYFIHVDVLRNRLGKFEIQINRKRTYVRVNAVLIYLATWLRAPALAPALARSSIDLVFGYNVWLSAMHVASTSSHESASLIIADSELFSFMPQTEEPLFCSNWESITTAWWDFVLIPRRTSVDSKVAPVSADCRHRGYRRPHQVQGHCTTLIH